MSPWLMVSILVVILVFEWIAWFSGGTILDNFRRETNGYYKRNVQIARYLFHISCALAFGMSLGLLIQYLFPR